MQLAQHANPPRLPESGAQRVTGNAIVKPLLLLFVASCIFDPADKALGLKLDLFLLCWLCAILFMMMERGAARLDVRLLSYVLAFLAIPLFSVGGYWLLRGGDPFEGWNLLKGYFLISLSLLLYLRRVNLMPAMCAMLSLLAVVIIVSYAVLTLVPEAFAVFYVFGQATGIVIVDNRDYGGGLVMLQAYFVTSPMLAMAIAYYFHAMRNATASRARLAYALLTLLNVAGMILAGTRNNLAVAVMLPVVLHFMYARNKVVHGIFALGFVTLLFVVFSGPILQLLDPTEVSNQLKVALVGDYYSLLDDPQTLLAGQGLGAYHYWDARASYFYISELTYFELLRNFGVVGFLAMIALLSFPLVYAFFVNRRYRDRHLIVAYGFYLLMCMSNPNLFSSMGILILSIILANIFITEESRVRS